MRILALVAVVVLGACGGGGGEASGLNGHYMFELQWENPDVALSIDDNEMVIADGPVAVPHGGVEDPVGAAVITDREIGRLVVGGLDAWVTLDPFNYTVDGDVITGDRTLVVQHTPDGNGTNAVVLVATRMSGLGE